MHLLLPLLTSVAAAGPTVVVTQPVALVQAIELPIAARDLRRAGGLEVDLRITLDGARQKRLPPADVAVVFREYALYGPVHGFGPFVVARWGEGLRGPALTRALHREYKWKRGKPGHGPDDARHGGKHGGKHVYVWGESHGRAGHGKHGHEGKGRGGGNPGKGHGKGHGKGKD